VNSKLSKTWHLGNVNVTFLAEAFNLFNFKHFSTYGMAQGVHYVRYQESLQFKEEVYEELGFKHLAGDDRLGEYRDPDVDYQPMDYINAAYQDDDKLIPYAEDEGVYFWVDEENAYMTYSATDGWTDVSDSEVQKVLDDKAYIYNPPNESLTFLNPRDIFMGLKLSYNF